MKLLKRYAPAIRLSIGVLLLVAGIAATYLWFYRWAPMRRLGDPAWLKMHSEAARWEEEQKDYRRTGRSPDVFWFGDRIGYYGDKHWFLWLEEKIRDDDHFRHCGCTEDVLATMVNQHPVSWREWRTSNEHKTQEEWIQDGFKAVGIEIHNPPSEADILPLLTLLGRNSWSVLIAGTGDQ